MITVYGPITEDGSLASADIVVHRSHGTAQSGSRCRGHPSVGEDDAMSVVTEDLHFPHGAVLIGNTLVVAETFGSTLTAFDGDDGAPGSAG